MIKLIKNIIHSLSGYKELQDQIKALEYKLEKTEQIMILSLDPTKLSTIPVKKKIKRIKPEPDQDRTIH